MRLTASQVADYLRQAGFIENLTVPFATISYCESGWETLAHNSSGEDSRGLLQINIGPGANTDLAGMDLFDPLQNCRAAMIVFQRQGLSAWTTYNGPCYRQNLAMVEQALNQQPQPQSDYESRIARLERAVDSLVSAWQSSATSLIDTPDSTEGYNRDMEQLPNRIVPPYRERSEVELASGHTLSYHGGRTIKSPKVFALFAGPVLNQAQITDALKKITEDGYLDPLQSYMSGRGKYSGNASIPSFNSTIADSDIQQAIMTAINSGVAPQNDGSYVYFVYLPDGVTVKEFGGTNCQTFCGYHSNVQGNVYCVVPGTACIPCHGNFQPFDALCMVSAHELAECITNPYGGGWYEDGTGEENADICAWQQVPYGPYQVQPYWTNEQGCTVGAYAPAQPPPPPPPPSTGGLTDEQKQAVQAMIDASLAKLKIVVQ